MRPQDATVADAEGLGGCDADGPAPKKLADYLNVPCCAACGAHALTPAGPYSAKDTEAKPNDLRCAVCGWIVVGTPEQVAQAKRAEEAWNARTDKRGGPWTRVLKARAKREKNQLRLFDASRSTERTGGC